MLYEIVCTGMVDTVFQISKSIFQKSNLIIHIVADNRKSVNPILCVLDLLCFHEGQCRYNNLQK